MCGIAGVFGSGRGEDVRLMLDEIKHRGPDDGHFVFDEHFSIGARRLSILDVSGGRQPLANEDGSIWAAQNGEIYNYPSLKDLLCRQGHTFHTHCDTELLPHLWEEYETKLAEKLDGMFAVAIWDKRKRVGYLARDRFGKKPLYYLRSGGNLWFASEIKSLLKVPGFVKELNDEALHHYLSYKHVPHPQTIFRGIFSLPPGHELLFSGNGEIRVDPYYRLDFSPNEDISSLGEDKLVTRLDELLRAGVKKRLLSDVPIGFFLSGGLDSSLSAAIAAETATEKIKTFTLVYREKNTTAGKESDKYWADWVARKYATEHIQVEMDYSGFTEDLRRVIRAFDEPFAGVMSTYFLSREVAKHVKVALSGDGADELFGSYLPHRLAFPVENYQKFVATGEKALLAPFEEQPETVALYSNKELWQWRSMIFVFNEEEKQALYSKGMKQGMSAYSSAEHLRMASLGLTAHDALNRVLELEYKGIFPDQVLAFVDRLSMAHSLEIRSAYLDKEFVAFASRIPGEKKLRRGESKYLLKKLAERYFPQEMIYRKKEGFLLPITEWFLGDMKEFAREKLAPKNLVRHDMFDHNEVARLLSMLDNPKANYRDVNRVFSLLVFQEWYDIYFG